MIFHVKVVFKKDNFLLPFSFIIFHLFFQNFKKKKKIILKLSLQKTTFMCVFKLKKKKKLYETRLYKRQLSRVFSKKIIWKSSLRVKVVCCKDDFRLNFFFLKLSFLKTIFNQLIFQMNINRDIRHVWPKNYKKCFFFWTNLA